jgi:hypothetical protein
MGLQRQAETLTNTRDFKTMNLLKTILLALVTIAFIHDPSYAATTPTPFVGTSVFATTNVQPAAADNTYLDCALGCCYN